jgi:DNA replication protein DnaC
MWGKISRDQFYCSQQCLDVAIDKQKQENAKRDAERMEQLILRVIPKKYHTIESDKKDLIRMCLNKSVFITGDAGTGKTVLMATIAKMTMRAKPHESYPVKWISYPAFIMTLQSMFKGGDMSPFDFAEDVALFNGLLCIDDIGAEKLTDYVRQTTYYIINEREQRMLPIIMTSNFSLSQIDEMVDPRISSRIAGICETIKLTGKDRRLTKGA